MESTGLHVHEQGELLSWWSSDVVLHRELCSSPGPLATDTLCMIENISGFQSVVTVYAGLPRMANYWSEALTWWVWNTVRDALSKSWIKVENEAKTRKRKERILNLNIPTTPKFLIKVSQWSNG